MYVQDKKAKKKKRKVSKKDAKAMHGPRSSFMACISKLKSSWSVRPEEKPSGTKKGVKRSRKKSKSPSSESVPSPSSAASTTSSQRAAREKEEEKKKRQAEAKSEKAKKAAEAKAANKKKAQEEKEQKKKEAEKVKAEKDKIKSIIATTQKVGHLNSPTVTPARQVVNKLNSLITKAAAVQLKAERMLGP